MTVVGAGNVGATVAQRLGERNDTDVVLVDIVPGLPQGRALDMLQAGPIGGWDSRVTGTNDYDASAGSDIVVVTSGQPRRPGMSRDELVAGNARIVADVVAEVTRRSPDCLLLIVTNPLDAMAQLAMAVSGFPRERVIGMAGVLDTARFRSLIATEVGASVRDVQAVVLGGHGDTMVPLTRLTTVAGVPVGELIPAARLEHLIQRVRDGGAEIVELVKTGSAYYAPSAAVAQMVDAILRDTRQVLPCSVLLDGEYGVRGSFTGVPVRLGAAGMVEVMELALTEAESAALGRSVRAVRDVVDLIAARFPLLEGLHPGPAPGS